MMVPEERVPKLTSDLHTHVCVHAHLFTLTVNAEREKQTNKNQRKGRKRCVVGWLSKFESMMSRLKLTVDAAAPAGLKLPWFWGSVPQSPACRRAEQSQALHL